MLGAAPQVDDLGAQVLRGEDVERAERFVHAQDFRLRYQRPRKTDALAHAARQLLRVRILVAGQADELERPVDLLLFLLHVESALDEAHLYVFLHRKPRIEGEALEHDRQAVVDTAQRRPVTEDGALCRVGEARHQSQDGGFARTRLSQQGEHLAFTYLEIDVIEHGHGRSVVCADIRLRSVPQLNERRRAGHGLVRNLRGWPISE